MLMNDPSWKEASVRAAAIDDFNDFFTGQYRVVLTAQSEMKYFPPVAAVREWKKNKQLLPSEVDQPDVDRVDQSALLDQLSNLV